MWDTRPALRGPQGRPLLPALTAPRCPRTRSRRATRTSRTRRSTCASRSPGRPARCARATRCSCGRRRRGRSSPTPPSPSTPSSTYVRTADGYVLAEALVERVLGEGAAGRRPLPRAPTCSARRYEPPFPFIPAAEYGEKGHTVLPGDFVTAEDGTGIVHTAIAFGEDDFRLGAEQGLNVVNPVRLDGTYDERIGPYAGRWVKDADPDLIEDLRARGRLLRAERLLHAYPHCWRCGTPLLYYAKPSWYIRTSQLRDRLLAANETVDWHPRAHQARPLRQAGWRTTSTGRSRASATGARRCRSGAARTGHAECDRLARRAARAARGVDARGPAPARTSTTSTIAVRRRAASAMRRVPEVIDVWFDSGSMPFAQWHAPFENQEQLRGAASRPTTSARRSTRRAAGSTRCSRSRRCCSTSSPYRTVLCLGHIADPEGKKMSKSLGNIVVPWDVIDRHGADAFRWYFFTSKQPWDGYLFSAETVGESVRQFLLQLWNTYGFYVLYANVNGVEPADARAGQRPRPLGALAPAPRPSRSSRERLDDYDATRAGHAIAAFVDDLSNWYVRRSRRRFWDGDPAAFATLRTCLVDGRAAARAVHARSSPTRSTTTSTAPSRASTCATCPRPARATRSSRPRWRVVRETVRLGLAARGQAKLKVRQPLRAAVVVAAGARARGDRAPRRRRAARSSTSRSCATSSQADELGSYEVKPNYRALGPRFGKQMPQVAAAVAALDPAHVAARAARRRPRRHQRRRPRPRARRRRPAARDAAARRLPARARGLARGGARARARRRAAPRGARARDRARGPERAQGGRACEVEDRIALALGGDDELLAAARAHEDYVAGETLARRGRLRRRRRRRRAATIEGRELRDRACAAPRLRRQASAGSSSASRRFLGIAPDALGLLAVAEEDQRRDREDLVVRRRSAGSRRC